MRDSHTHRGHNRYPSRASGPDPDVGFPRRALRHLSNDARAALAQHLYEERIAGRRPPVPLPEEIRTPAEKFGGASLRDVRVQHDSPEPARHGARAFARGKEIHLGPGEEAGLAHEAWHVVQQKTGRTGPGFDAARLEREADFMGQKLERGQRGPEEQRNATDMHEAGDLSKNIPVTQYLKEHAEAYNSKHKLLDTVTKASVEAYVSNAKNPLNHRQALLAEWNKGQTGRHAIGAGLASGAASDVTALDSDDDDEMSLTQEAAKAPQVQLHRPTSGATQSVPSFDVSMATRYARQATKRNEQQKRTPFVVSSGGFQSEIASPRPHDMVAVPLQQSSAGGGSSMQRHGNPPPWTAIASSLQSTGGGESMQQQVSNITGAFFGTGQPTTQAQATAVAAMIPDLAQGLAGGGQHLKALQDSAESDPQKLFGGRKPVYQPAGKGGRKLVREAHGKLKKDKAPKDDDDEIEDEEDDDED